MKKDIKNQLIPLSIGVLFLCFLFILFTFAWTGAPGSPPDPNAPAPINVSISGQEKEGQVGIAIPSGESLDPSYGLTVGTASNPLGIKTSGDLWIEKKLTGIKPTGVFCGDNQVLKFNSLTSNWICADDIGGMIGGGTDNYLARWDGSSALEISSIYQDDLGNVGIGTTAPGTKLDVNGDMFVQGIGPKYSTWSGIGDGGAAIVNDNNAYKSLMIVGSDQNNADGRCDNLRCIRMWDRVTVEGELYTTGNVGIGTTSPGARLSVDGDISVSGTGMWNHSGTVVYSGTPSAETWLTLDLSSYVGANHALVFLRFYDTTSGGAGYWLRTGALLPLDFGSDARTDDTSGCAAVNVRNNNQGIGYVMIETDSDGKTHWKASLAHSTQIVLVGYIK